MSIVSESIVAAPKASPSTSTPEATPRTAAAQTGEAVAALAARLEADGVTFRPPPGETPNDTLLRFLNARQGNLSKASAFLAADAAWRAEQRIDELRELEASEVLGSAKAVAAVGRVLPVAYGGGVDRQGRPVIWKHFGAQCRVSKLLDVTSLEHLSRYNAWLSEQFTLCLRDAKATKWTVVMDAEGWHVGLGDRTAMRFLKNMAELDANHYPERLAHIVVINAPAMLAGAWRIIRGWLDEVTRDKVDIISSAEAASARLDSLIDPSQRPALYGGTQPALDGWPVRAGLKLGAHEKLHPS